MSDKTHACPITANPPATAETMTAINGARKRKAKEFNRRLKIMLSIFPDQNCPVNLECENRPILQAEVVHKEEISLE